MSCKGHLRKVPDTLMDNGYWSMYSEKGAIASSFCHGLNIALLEAVSLLAEDSLFKEVAVYFAAYQGRRRNRQRAFLKGSRELSVVSVVQGPESAGFSVVARGYFQRLLKTRSVLLRDLSSGGKSHHGQDANLHVGFPPWLCISAIVGKPFLFNLAPVESCGFWCGQRPQIPHSITLNLLKKKAWQKVWERQ